MFRVASAWMLAVVAMASAEEVPVDAAVPAEAVVPTVATPPAADADEEELQPSPPPADVVVQMVAAKYPIQHLRGNTSSVAGLDVDVMGVPANCPRGCTFYFFGCGTLGNPPQCEGVKQLRCCQEGR